jgi:hypothetical protein
MRIVQSEVALASQRSATVSDTTRSTIQAWVGERPRQTPLTRVSIGAAATPAATAAITAQAKALAAHQSALAGRHVSISVPQLSSAGQTAGSAQVGPDMTDPAITDPNLAVLVALIERLTGHKIHLIRPGDIQTHADAAAQQAGQAAAAAVAAAQGTNGGAPQPQQAGWGVEVHVEQIHQETETTAYSATGQVTTADGQTISFEYGVAMQRDLTQKVAVDIQAGDAVRKVDPLALNLDGGPVALGSTRAGFDLNSDGTAEKVALPTSGTYFIALDRNGNGTIDNGSELFGPSTGNGFTELKALDSDGNGWIDEADTAYASLKLWSGPEAATKSLAEAGVGALYVGKSVSTQFDIRSAANETLGQVISSSIYLSENGKPGALQQVDLTV